jgi:hypothetical protein
MTEHPHYDEIWDAVQSLIADGFAVTAALRDDGFAFGNAAIDLLGGDLWIRLTYDRGQRLASVATASECHKHADLKAVLEELGVDTGVTPWSNFNEPVLAILTHRARLPAAVAAARESVRRYWDERAREFRK